MTENERKSMLIRELADTIQGEINRMCVTKELSELDSMALHARKNIEKLRSTRYELDFKIVSEAPGMIPQSEIDDLITGEQ